jgi:hypothetical protein
MEINLIYIMLVVFIFVIFISIKNKENTEKMEHNNMCDIDQKNIFEIMSIVQQIGLSKKEMEEIVKSDNPEKYFISEKYTQKINRLTSLLKKYDYKTIKCLINQNEMAQKQKIQYCNAETRNDIMRSLNLIDALIDKYGFNIFLLVDHYSKTLEEIEKDCYQNYNPEIIKKIKSIIRKLSTIITTDKKIKEQLNYKQTEFV